MLLGEWLEQEEAKREEKYINHSYISSHVGAIGDKIEFNIDYARLVSTYQTIFGEFYLYEFSDEQGHKFIWNTKVKVECRFVKYLTGFVKNHSEYNGIKQTELINCKCYRLDPNWYKKNGTN